MRASRFEPDALTPPLKGPMELERPEEDETGLLVGLAPSRYRGDDRLCELGFDLAMKGMWVATKSARLSPGTTGTLLAASGFALGRLGAALFEVGRSDAGPSKN